MQLVDGEFPCLTELDLLFEHGAHQETENQAGRHQDQQHDPSPASPHFHRNDRGRVQLVRHQCQVRLGGAEGEIALYGVRNVHLLTLRHGHCRQHQLATIFPVGIGEPVWSELHFRRRNARRSRAG